jgi:hypothetical protein
MYLANSYASANSLYSIAELQSPSVLSGYGVIILPVLLLGSYYLYKRRLEAEGYIAYMWAGTFLLAGLHIRNIWFMLFPLLFLLTDMLPKDLLNIKLGRKGEWQWVVGTIPLCFIALIYIFMSVVSFHSKYDGIVTDDSNYTEVVQGAVDILAEYSQEDVTVYTDFNYGCYFEFLGYQVYLDTRPELYRKQVNGQEDILMESYQVYTGTADYPEFLEKYEFSHLLTREGTGLATFLKYNAEQYGYRQVWVSFYEEADEVDDEEDEDIVNYGFILYERISFAEAEDA